MKKKFTLSFAVLFFAIFSASFVKAQPYYFSMSTGSYTDLSGATVANGTTVWDNQFFAIPIGFTFDFWGTNYDSVKIRDIGVMFDALFAHQVEVFSADLCDRGIGSPAMVSPLGYLLDGSAGSHILKIEWKNAGFKGEYTASATTNDYVNAQLWLYEGSNNIEVRIGSNSITNPAVDYWSGEQGPFIGVSNWTTFDYLKLDGNPASPTPINADSALDGTPANGSIYLFSTTPIAIDEEFSSSINIYPNPATGIINIAFGGQRDEQVSISLLDLTGRKIAGHSDWILSGGTYSLNLSHNPAGVYFVEMVTTKGKFTKKVVQE